MAGMSNKSWDESVMWQMWNRCELAAGVRHEQEIYESATDECSRWRWNK